jgi:hypothetical protein
MPHDLDQLVAASTADFEAFSNGMVRAQEAFVAALARAEWRGATPLTNGDGMTITHLFDGQEREFAVPTKDVGVFEACLPGRSAYACLQRFVDNQWTVDDVAVVLSLALYGPTRQARQAWHVARYALDLGVPTVAITQYRPHPDVVATVTRDGPANFAGLAAEILSAVLFGEAEAAPTKIVDDEYGNQMEVPADGAA